MSHIVTIQTQAKDAHAIASACRRLGIAAPQHGTAKLFDGEATGLLVRLPGWLYPLVEVNCLYHVHSVSFGLDTRRGFVDFGNFESEGNVVTLAAGVNAVLVPERLEIGAVYSTVVASQGNFDANSLLVKMVLRY